ncbi:MAG: SpoIIE family protein phosphatase [Thermodesulfobacteriota bacterium]
MTMIVASASIIFLAMIIFNYFFLKKNYLAQAREAAINFSNTKAQQVSLLLADAESVAETLAPIAAGCHFTETELNQILKDAVKNNPEIFGMAIAFEPRAFKPELYHFMPYVYRQGETIKQVYAGSQGYDYFNWRWYAVPKETNRGWWSEPYQDPVNNTIVCTFAVPFSRSDRGRKNFQGVVTASINLKWLQDLVAGAKIFDHGYAFLLSREGVFVTVPKKEWIMNLNIFFAATITDNPELRQAGRKMIAGEEGFVRIKDFIHNRESWLYFAPFPVSGFSLGVVIPENELLAGLYRLSQRLTVICLAGLLFLVVVAILISRKITHPLLLLERSAAAIAAGNLDVALPPPATRDEIGSLTRSFTEMQEALKEYIANLAATTAAKERIESELKIAHSIQMNFLPKKFPPLPAGEFVEIAAVLEPAREVGGDLYDYFLVDDRHLFFMVGDVSGKGVPAALLMAVTKTLLKGLTEVGLQPAEIFAKVNRELASENDSLMFVTSFCGILDLVTGDLAYSNAGHNPPLLLRSGQAPQWLTLPEGFFLGVFPETVYHTRQIKLLPHDLILAYTDGVVEAVDVHQNFYANERLITTVTGIQERSAEAVVKTVKDSVATFSQGAPQADDFTILALRFKGHKGR